MSDLGIDTQDAFGATMWKSDPLIFNAISMLEIYIYVLFSTKDNKLSIRRYRRPSIICRFMLMKNRRRV